MLEELEAIVQDTKFDPSDALTEAEQDKAFELARRRLRARKERERRARAAVAARQMSQDVPLCPASEFDASPILPTEANDSLSAEQRLALASLVSGQSFTMAARAANVDRRTIYRWRQEEAFADAFDHLTRDALETTATRVRNLMLRATRVLAESMLGNNGFNGAIRVVNSGRLWNALNAGAQKLEEREATRAQGNG